MDSKGVVTIKGSNGDPVGKIKVSNVIGDNSLIAVGEVLFVPKPGAKILASNDYSIMQGYSELSNVDIATEMAEMLMTQRAFQLSSATLKTADEMW